MTLSDFSPYSLLLKLGTLIALALLVLGVYTSIRNAYTQRTEFKQQAAALQEQLKSERTARDFDVAQANLTTETYRLELAVRDKIARDAADRSTTISKELHSAQSVISAWRSKADANLRACLDLPLPVGLFDKPAEAAPAARAGH